MTVEGSISEWETWCELEGLTTILQFVDSRLYVQLASGTLLKKGP